MYKAHVDETKGGWDQGWKAGGGPGGRGKTETTVLEQQF